VENREVKNQWENEDCSLIKCNMQAWKRVNCYGNKIVINELKQIYYLEIINILFKTQWNDNKNKHGYSWYEWVPF